MAMFRAGLSGAIGCRQRQCVSGFLVYGRQVAIKRENHAEWIERSKTVINQCLIQRPYIGTDYPAGIFCLSADIGHFLAYCRGICRFRGLRVKSQGNQREENARDNCGKQETDSGHDSTLNHLVSDSTDLGIDFLIR
ncbi:hypothetical protein [Paracoccus xiamenensis]|uniref:hypothetical protein n=1 Tax=Paracoccus xiamenensis TaxID=2714901 RepID=UPI00140CE2CC|nr:hypothetical protein [Paracoccus xiamenensis]NHF72004.1 hypothetical protein [Paracoccus xiamenensis]